jgi:hypothetical protein
MSNGVDRGQGRRRWARDSGTGGRGRRLRRGRHECGRRRRQGGGHRRRCGGRTSTAAERVDGSREEGNDDGGNIEDGEEGGC